MVKIPWRRDWLPTLVWGTIFIGIISANLISVEQATAAGVFFMTHLLKCDAIFREFINDNYSPTILRSLKYGVEKNMIKDGKISRKMILTNLFTGQK